MKTVPTVHLAGAGDTASFPQLPEETTLALADIAGAAREGLLAMSVAAGMAVMQAMLEAEVTQVAGPKGRHDPDRTVNRHGTDPGLGDPGWPAGAGDPPAGAHHRRPRGAAGQLWPLRRRGPAYAGGAGADARRGRLPATRPGRGTGRRAGGEDREVDLEVGGVATVRQADPDRAARAGGPRPDRARRQGVDTRRGAHGRAVRGGRAGEHRRRHQDPGRAVGRLHGEQDRGQVAAGRPGRPRFEDGLLVVLDGAKALAAGVREVFGDKAAIQRCTLHKRRNVADHLPEKDQAWVDAKLVKAFGHADPEQGLRNAKQLAGLLDKTHPGAAASLREGLEEMFTVSRLGIDGRLAKTLTTSNPIESMISIARTTNRNVTRWRDGQMVLRWTAAGMLNAERSVRRIKGYKQMPQLLAALHRHAHPHAPAEDAETVGAVA